MSESSEVLEKPADKNSNFHVFLIGVMIGGVLFMGLFVNLSLRQLQPSMEMVIREEILGRDELEYKFTAYMKKFGKSYNNSEYQRRLQYFKESILEIKMLNEAHKGSARFGFTKFSDMSKEELGKTIQLHAEGDYNQTCMSKNVFTPKIPKIEKKPPSKFDWRDQGVVTEVLDQGRCASCWAHCVVGIMESMVMIKNLPQRRRYSNISIQELIDCSTYTEGCCPGNPKTGFKFLCNSHLALTTASAYPLTNKKGRCKKDYFPKHGVAVAEYMVELNASPDRIVEIVAGYGPVTTIVNSQTWLNYRDGVITYHCSSADDHLIHVVQVVGYNREEVVPYFILRNSWGKDWGEQGYLKVAMNGACGVGKQITYVDVDIV